MVLWKCTKCGLIFAWKPRWLYISKHYKEMIEAGTASPEIMHGRFFGIKRHPKYLTPSCPACGGKSVWLLSREGSSRAQLYYIFKGKLVI